MARHQNTNPNNPVQGAEKADVNMGEMVSFDQVDSITDSQIDQEKQQKKSKKESDRGREDEIDELEDSEEQEEEEGSENSFEERDFEKEDNDETPSFGIQENSDVKLIKISQGDEQIDLHNNSQVPVKIDGKSESVELQELINNYSGKTNWDRKNNEFHQEKQKFLQDKAVVDAGVKKVYEAAQEDPLRGFEAFCELGGINFEEVTNGMVEKFQQLAGMDEAERREYQLNQKEERLKRRQEFEQKRKEAEENAKKVALERDELLNTYKISEDEYNTLQESLSANRETPATPRQVVEYQRAKMVMDAWLAVEPDKVFEQTTEAGQKEVALLYDLASDAVRKPHLGKDDWVDIIENVLSTDRTKRLSKKVRSSGKPQVTQTQQQKKKRRAREPLTFDDI